MLKIWYSAYGLQPLTQIGSLANQSERVGALIKIRWPDEMVGYADLFPWPELGDEDLLTQLSKLGRGHLTLLMEQTIWLARRDAVVRAESRNALQGLPRVKNHFLVNDPTRTEDATLESAKNAGFSTIKVKVGRQLEDEILWIEKVVRQFPQLSLRLDFNSSLTLPDFKDYMGALHPHTRARIELIEDPIPYHAEHWASAAAWGTLALDHEAVNFDWKKAVDPLPFKVLVVKPARQDVTRALEHAERFGLKIVVTSALDHPLGVAHATWVANEIKKSHPDFLLECGCLSLRSYKENEFAAAMTVQGPSLLETPGTGIGFDSLLEKTAWTAL